MLNKNYKCKSLKWDTNYFGFHSAKIDLNGIVDEQGQDEIIEFCKEYEFVTISNLNNIKENNYWIGTRTKSFLSDINIQLIKTVKEKPIYQDDSTYIVNKLSRNKEIEDIAKKSFNYSRFFNDPKLPKNKAKNIYLHWTECAFEKADKYFVICERKGEKVGYVLFSIDGEDIIIELIAVDQEYKGQGIGRSLIQRMELFIKNKKMNRIKVGTQINNIPAVKFYSAMGFKYVDCGSIYHLWIE